MAAKILIKRQFLEGQTEEIFGLVHELRIQARNQLGFITGETLHEHNNPKKTVLLVSWVRIENWFAWKESTERHQLEAMLEIYQEGPTEYEEYVTVAE